MLDTTPVPCGFTASASVVMGYRTDDVDLLAWSRAVGSLLSTSPEHVEGHVSLAMGLRQK